MLKPATSRAARGLLGWSQAKLAERAGVSRFTVINFENGVRRETSAANVAAIERALAAAGIKFQNGGQPGVRLVGGRRGAGPI